MSIAAFWILAAMLAMYVLLDGYDLGVAAISPFVSRKDDERVATMRSIEPFWNGNEVWLIAAGGVLFALFPKAYASAFSGFYLPLMAVLWLLMFRGIAIELRSHFPSTIWHEFWDACFSCASALLIVLFGVALGNLLRGVPLDASGYFQGTFAFLLNPYSLGVGLFALIVLAFHGAAFLIVRVDGAPANRARALLPRLWILVAATYFAMTAVTVWTHSGSVSANPALFIVALFSITALVVERMAMARKADLATFFASTAFLASLLVAAAGTIFPYVLPAYPVREAGISIFAASPPSSGLAVTIAVTVTGLVVVIAYSAVVWRQLAGKIRV